MTSSPADEHPSLFELEAHHVGEPHGDGDGDSGGGRIQAHVAACAVCRRYVIDLDAERTRFDDRGEADDFARQIRTRADAGGDVGRLPWRRRLVLPGAALATAACALLLFGPRWRDRHGVDDEADVLDVGSRDVRSKGAPAVAIILLHDGAQSRELGDVRGRAGDRFRIEIALPAPSELEAVMVAEAGARVIPVVPARRFEAGTHLLEPAYAFDSEPGTTRLLVGKPADVDRAVATGHPTDTVTVVRLIAAGGDSGRGGP